MFLAIQRIGLAVCVVLSILAVGVDAASAAGKPTSLEVTNGNGLGGYSVMELTVKVNPNGAGTSVAIEYREDGAKEETPWTKGLTHELSGTTIRSYSEEFRVDPGKNYEVRVKAKNLFGTTETAIVHKVATAVTTTGGKGLTNVPFASSGVAIFAFTYIGMNINVVCNETSSGSVGSPGGIKDVYKYEMSGCKSYYHGGEEGPCAVKNFSFTLKGPTLAVTGTGFIALPSYECAPGDQWQIYPGSFRVVDNGNPTEYSKVRPISLTATGHLYATNPAEIIIESNWLLSAEYTGTPFKFGLTGF
jgi:hypothetical protein